MEGGKISERRSPFVRHTLPVSLCVIHFPSFCTVLQENSFFSPFFFFKLKVTKPCSMIVNHFIFVSSVRVIYRCCKPSARTGGGSGDVSLFVAVLPCLLYQPLTSSRGPPPPSESQSRVFLFPTGCIRGEL